jgi:hypothetical protein
MKLLIGFLVAAAMASGCGGGVENTTCADVSRSTEKTEALVKAVAEKETLAADHVRAGLTKLCGQAKPDDKPYAALPRYAQVEFKAEIETIRRTLGDDAADSILRERQKAIRAKD